MTGSTNEDEEKIIRDPLYGFVEISPLEDGLLDTPLVQRLARIKQLAHTYVVFPSAVHNRLEHSIGTMYVAGRIAKNLGLAAEDQVAVRAAALIHDVGHGPFSHVFEDILRDVNGPDFTHENVTLAIVDHDQPIRDALGPLVDPVRGIIAKERGLLSSIISSSLDADKMDYLRRDSYHTGVAYGIFDIERVLRCVTSVRGEEEGRDYIAIEQKGMDALESYRLSRYSMHRQVYEHHTRLAADDMFVRSVRAAFAEGILKADDWNARDPKRLLETYRKFDDSSIMQTISTHSTGLAKRLADDIRDRRLLKRAYWLDVTEAKIPDWPRRKKLASLDPKDVQRAEVEIAGKAGLGPEDVIVHMQSTKIKLYEKFEQTIDSEEEPILVKRPDGSSEQMERLSPIHPDPVLVRQLYVFCPEKKKVEVARAATEKWGADNLRLWTPS